MHPTCRRNSRRWHKPLKMPVTLRLDADILAWFRSKGATRPESIRHYGRMTDDRKSPVRPSLRKILPVGGQ